MLDTGRLRQFEKMWTWLYEHPGHDQEYYMEFVAKLPDDCDHNCPLADNSSISQCTGCEKLWKTESGTLCTDPDSPLNKWQNTERFDADKRSYYADKVTLLASNYLQQH